MEADHHRSHHSSILVHSWYLGIFWWRSSDRRSNPELDPWMYKEHKDQRDTFYHTDAGNLDEAVNMSDHMNVAADRRGI
ncbi:uncharacterized protein N7498_005155 [Penicillium cinerascens]|uniref:Uncharacterized protein n=1 Tax=Penicillium cinerascens TaxID=70096 RepID=A0A9W9T048_9EURO|nr:uncharacterized protein N7498_005155 [Penicillium cinerascens]KAJ5204276.1 hypothetical protein N7498_005155 [Penicillium cinerascens]